MSFIQWIFFFFGIVSQVNNILTILRIIFLYDLVVFRQCNFPVDNEVEFMNIFAGFDVKNEAVVAGGFARFGLPHFVFVGELVEGSFDFDFFGVP